MPFKNREVTPRNPARPGPAVGSKLDRDAESRREDARARLAKLDTLLITDIDETLLGDDGALSELLERLREKSDRIGFGVASGRALELIQEVLEERGIEDIDVIVAAVGSEIYYGRECSPDEDWARRLTYRWSPGELREALASLPFLRLQEEPHTQRPFKLSYHLDLDGPARTEEALSRIHAALEATRSACSLIHSHGTFIDLLPCRASKGKAIGYLSRKWNIPLERIVTAGDSGNDRDMLTGSTAAIVVGNHDAEISALRDSPHRVYFARGRHAAGILEGLAHYNLVEDWGILARPPQV